MDIRSWGRISRQIPRLSGISGTLGTSELWGVSRVSRSSRSSGSPSMFSSLSRARSLYNVSRGLRRTPATIGSLLPSSFQVRFNSQLPKNVGNADLSSNSIRNRIPQFPFHKEAIPTLIPKPNTPRVSKSLTFSTLMGILKDLKEPELIYMAESHRLYLLASFALAFIVCYNVFDVMDAGIRAAYNAWLENEQDLPAVRNAVKSSLNFWFALAIASVYGAAAFMFAMIPTRLIRKMVYLPGPKPHIQFTTHPWIPGRPSPVYTLPIEKVSIGRTAKAWTGRGFYGASHRSQFMLFLHEDGKFLPWIVDRSGWLWGDARVWDVLFGKEPIAQAELGLSYDDMMKIQQSRLKKVKENLKVELGPAWKLKSIVKLMKEDVDKLKGKKQEVPKIKDAPQTKIEVSDQPSKKLSEDKRSQ